jgi:hypothetical protein
MTCLVVMFMMFVNEGEDSQQQLIRSLSGANNMQDHTDFMAVYYEIILIDLDSPVLAPGFFTPVLY